MARARANSSRPAIWSISAPVSTTALIGLAAQAIARMKRAHRRICWRRSGEALIRTQFSPSPVTARLACVRGRTRAIPGPGQTADRTAAIPLRKATTRRGAEHDGGQSPHSGLAQWRQRSEFGRQIAVDLQPDADLDKGRGGPGHFEFPCSGDSNTLREAPGSVQGPTRQDADAPRKKPDPCGSGCICPGAGNHLPEGNS